MGWHWTSGRSISVASHNRAVDELLQLARISRHLSDEAIRGVIGRDVKLFLQQARWIPWVTLDRNEDGDIRFTIDYELKAICEGRAARPQLSGKSLLAALDSLCGEIDRRRTENQDSAKRSRWNPEIIKTREQTDLLNWIEAELAEIRNQAATGIAPTAATTDDAIVMKESTCTD